MGKMGTAIAREAEALEWRWAREPRWTSVRRPYSAEDVIRLRGSTFPEHTLARRGAERLWELLRTEDVVAALGCMTGGQAVACVKAGLRRSISPGGRWRRTRTWPVRRTPINPSIR